MRYFLEIVFTFFTATFVGAQRQGDLCVMAGTIQPGVCRHVLRCPAVLEAAFNGLPYQVCASPENLLIVCCPWVPGQETRLQARYQANTTTPREGDNCTMVDTRRAGVCSRFGNCQIAIEAASKGISPQICALEGNVQIICCPRVTVAEGDQCSIAKTGRAGKCLRLSNCPIAVEAALNGITPQICALHGSIPIVCCEGVVEGNNCTMLDTGRARVCRPFENCQTAREATYKGISPQICALEDRVLIVCCPPVTVIEGNNCSLVDTGRAGVCKPFSNCQTAKDASYKGIFPQICDIQGSVQIVCCPPVTVIEGDNCTIVDTGRAGVCRPFATCPTAMEAASTGIFPRTCDVEGAVRIVCCPLSTVIEGSTCLAKDTKIAGIYKPFANCQTAMKAASEGTLPQISALEDNVQIICCPLVIEGSNCTLMDTGMAGVCRLFANCRRAKKASGRGVAPQKCDLTDIESKLVCCAETDCPPLPRGLVTQLAIGSKAADYCIELAEKIHPCQETRSGWTRGDMCPLLTPDSNIVYHMIHMTTTAEAPYYGRVGSGQTGNITWDGHPVSLVSDQWVLYAAFAIDWLGSSSVKFVGLGGTLTPQYNPDEIYGVTKQYIHPLYNGTYSATYNNIVLLQLDREVEFTRTILPVCLHTGTPLPDSGFIHTGQQYKTKTEYKMSMQIVSQEECSKVLPIGSSQHPAGVKHDVEICSRPVNTTGECGIWYDGASLILRNSHRVACTHLLVGLKSGHTYSPCTYTNTRISGFIPWIEGIVWPESGVVV